MARAINPAALREIRDLVGLSRRELGKRCDVAGGTITNLELGNHGCSPELQRKLADALGVKLDAITVPTPEAVTA